MSRTEGCCFSSSRPSGLIQPPSIYDFGYPCLQNECTSPVVAAAAGSSIYDFGYPRPQNECARPVAYNMVSKAGSFSYSRFGNDNPAQEIGWDHGDFENKDDRPYMIRWKSGKKVDQKLMMLLESFFQEIYVKRQDFFKKIFPGLYEEFTDVFNKIGAMLRKNNDETRHPTMTRSLSVGSPRRLERFRVRAPIVIVANSDCQGAPAGQQPATGSGNNTNTK